MGRKTLLSQSINVYMLCALQVCGTYTATGWRLAASAAWAAVQPSTGVACVSAAAVIISTVSSHMSAISSTEPTTWLLASCLLILNYMSVIMSNVDEVYSVAQKLVGEAVIKLLLRQLS